MEDNKKTGKDQANKDAVVKPDPETLHTTDPQDHMEGPISSLVQGVKEEAEKEDKGSTDKK
ncbi:MAG TPA: hypothetical protein VL307_08815 [Chitinophagaceae bacterium]|nr:hypothetical protein [Chitinophagaceae bacterium]